MTYEQIKETIESDYDMTMQARVSRFNRDPSIREISSFYWTFREALTEIHLAIGPFTQSTEDFISQIRYKKEVVSPQIYDIIVAYCKDSLKLDI